MIEVLNDRCFFSNREFSILLDSRDLDISSRAQTRKSRWYKKHTLARERRERSPLSLFEGLWSRIVYSALAPCGLCAAGGMGISPCSSHKPTSYTYMVLVDRVKCLDRTGRCATRLRGHDNIVRE
jgi:hypothetical protein